MKLEDNLELLRKSHGRRVTCEIYGKKITDAKISVVDGNSVHICQNEQEGGWPCLNKLGYIYAWMVDTCVKNLRFSPQTLRDIQVGGMVVDYAKRERKVLAICGEAFLPSDISRPSSVGEWRSFTEAEENSWKIKDQPEEPAIISLDEIAKKFGIPVEKLKIKKDEN